MVFIVSCKRSLMQLYTSVEIQRHEIDYIGCKSIIIEIYGKMIIG
ncbi:MAG: hypothetical protein RL609_1662 [Bacteroidota bacterium]